VVEADGHEIAVGHHDLVFFSELRETRLDVVRHYHVVRTPSWRRWAAGSP